MKGTGDPLEPLDLEEWEVWTRSSCFNYRGGVVVLQERGCTGLLSKDRSRLLTVQIKIKFRSTTEPVDSDY